MDQTRLKEKANWDKNNANCEPEKIDVERYRLHAMTKAV